MQLMKRKFVSQSIAFYNNLIIFFSLPTLERTLELPEASAVSKLEVAEIVIILKNLFLAHLDQLIFPLNHFEFPSLFDSVLDLLNLCFLLFYQPLRLLLRLFCLLEHAFVHWLLQFLDRWLFLVIVIFFILDLLQQI